MNRDELITENLGLVGSCASRFLGKGVEYEDLYSAGCIGLIHAADRFDESLGFAFSTYAVPAILGEIRRIFRDEGSVKISRSLKEKARNLRIAAEKFQKENGAEPTVSELAETLGIDIAETAELLCVSSPTLSLTNAEDEKQTDIPIFDEYPNIDNRISVHQIIDTLPETDRKLIYLRYFNGLTQTKTAKELGISQVQVSRLENRIMEKLRERALEKAQ